MTHSHILPERALRTNPPIPEPLADRFRLGAAAFDEGRRAMVESMRAYRDECGHVKGFSIHEMYKEFSALTKLENDQPRVTPRTIRYYYEAVDGVPDKLYDLFEKQVLTFEHCNVDRQITAEQGLARGYCLEWAIKPMKDGRKPRSAAAIVTHFADNNGKTMDEILLINWRTRVSAILHAPLPENGVSAKWRKDVTYHQGALAELLENVKDLTFEERE